MKATLVRLAVIGALILGGSTAYVVHAAETKEAKEVKNGKEKEDEGEEKEGEDEEESLTETQVPASILAAAKAAVPGGVFAEATKEEEDDVDVYEVKLKTADGREIEAVLSADAQLLELEEELAENALPAKVSTALKDLFASGKTVEIEKKTYVVYEVKKQVGEKSYEIEIGSDGEILSIEAEDED